MAEPSYVVITEAPQMGYMQDYAVLPRNYGSKDYFNRAERIHLKKLY